MSTGVFHAYDASRAAETLPRPRVTGSVSSSEPTSTMKKDGVVVEFVEFVEFVASSSATNETQLEQARPTLGSKLPAASGRVQLTLKVTMLVPPTVVFALAPRAEMFAQRPWTAVPVTPLLVLLHGPPKMGTPS